VYTLVIENSLISDPAQKWRNTFDFSNATVPHPLDGVVTSLTALSNTFIHSDSQTDKVTCYNWAKGRQPYPNGTPIFERLFGTPGSADTAWTPPLSTGYEPQGGEVVFRVDHAPVGGGRPGRSFFRAFLGSEDIQSTSGGKWFLSASLSSFQTKLDSIITSTGLAPYLGGGLAGTAVVVVRYSPKTNIVHGAVNVEELNAIGVSTNKQTRKNKK
jgi:hypothetical protein